MFVFDIGRRDTRVWGGVLLLHSHVGYLTSCVTQAWQRCLQSCCEYSLKPRLSCRRYTPRLLEENPYSNLRVSICEVGGIVHREEVLADGITFRYCATQSYVLLQKAGKKMINHRAYTSL
jgi:hypothetical protein